MMKQSHGMKNPITLRRVLTTAAVIFLAAVLLIAPVAAADDGSALITHTHDETWVNWGDDEAEKTRMPTSQDMGGATTWYIHLVGDVTLSECLGDDNGCYWEIPIDTTVYLCLDGHVIQQTCTACGQAMVIGIFGTLNLYDCNTITKHYFTPSNEYSNNGIGLWVLDDTKTDSPYSVTGGVITGGRYTHTYYVDGAGITVYGGELNMYGGNVVGNYKATSDTAGAGVGICNSGTGTMIGGSIIGNYAIIDHTNKRYASGGGVGVSDSTFTMTGGKISNNYAANGLGVSVSGYSGKFIMTGGDISNNGGGKGGVSVVRDGGNIELSGGTVTNNLDEFGRDVFFSTVGNPGSIILTGNVANSQDQILYIRQVQEGMGGDGITLQDFTGNLGKVFLEEGEYDGLLNKRTVFTVTGEPASKALERVALHEDMKDKWALVAEDNAEGTGGVIKLYLNLPSVKNPEQDIRVTWINSTKASVDVLLDPAMNSAEEITVVFCETGTTTPVASATKTGDFPAGELAEEFQVTGLSAGQIYDVTVTLTNNKVQNDETNSNVYTVSNKAAPKPYSVEITGNNGAAISATGVTIAYNGEATFGVLVKDDQGNTLADEPVTWDVSDTTNTYVEITDSTEITATLKGKSATDAAVTLTATHSGIATPATVSVSVSEAAISSITIAPATEACEVGKEITLTVTATDAANNDRIGETLTWTIPDGLTPETVSAKTGEAVSFTTETAGTYTITAKYSEGITASATLTFVGKPTVTAQPISETYVQGESAVGLTVTAANPSGTTEGLTYKWFTSSYANFADGGTEITGAAESCPVSTDAEGTFYYRAEVTYTEGTVTTTAYSDVAAITVVKPTVDELIINPTTTEYTFYSGDKAEISATARNTTVNKNFDVFWDIKSGSDIVSIATNGNTATVTENGKAGTAEIVAFAGDLKQTIKVNVIVTEAAPTLPTIETETDATTGTSTITAASNVISYSGNTATIEDDTVKLTIKFETLEPASTGSQAIGVVGNTTAEYKEISAETTNGQDVKFKLTLNLANATDKLPTLSANLDQTVKTAVEGADLVPFAMVSATQNADAIAEHLAKTGDRVVIVFTVPTVWVESVDEIYYFHYKGSGLVEDPKPIEESGDWCSIQKGTTVTTITLKVNGFSTHGIASGTAASLPPVNPQPQPQPQPQPVTPQPGSSTPQGSSVWLTESQTPTETPEQPTEKPTDSAPTDVPSTQPTATETQSPGFGVLAVFAGLGAVAVLRRK